MMNIIPERFRALAGDILCSVTLFTTVSLLSGRISRNPFDDEIYSLQIITSDWTLSEILSFFLHGGDVHPPLSYLFFLGLHAIGAEETAMRAASCFLMAAALALFHGWTLITLERRHGGAVAPLVRLVAILLFGLNALAISQGDALRWYPLFSLLVALFVVLYLTRRSPVSAVPLGLAASTNFLALPLAACWGVWRYGVERRLEWKFERQFWALFVLFAFPGLVTALSLALPGVDPAHSAQFEYGTITALLSNALGFFGGNTLGITQAWAVLPIALVSAAALWSVLDRKTPANPLNLLLFLFIPPILMAVAGFGKPRSFLYLAPILSALLTVFIADRVAREKFTQAVALTALTLCSLVGAVVTLRDNDRPYKRNSVIPFDVMMEAVRLNVRPPALVITNESVSKWLLTSAFAGPGDCVIGPGRSSPCSSDVTQYRTIVTVYVPKAARPKPRGSVWDKLRDRSPTVTLHFGLDLDAAAKSRLTGNPIPEYLMEVQFYDPAGM